MAKIVCRAKEAAAAMVHCPCNSTKSLADCCGPLLDGSRAAATAEELMRSRYSAYARGEIGYILDTIHPDERANHDETTIREWSSESEWLGLEILGTTESSGEEDATVEFIAHYKSSSGESVAHHELSQFARIGGQWFFRDGTPVGHGTVVREAPKVGRNEPCPCGSGRKFKKCCAV